LDVLHRRGDLLFGRTGTALVLALQAEALSSITTREDHVDAPFGTPQTPPYSDLGPHFKAQAAPEFFDSSLQLSA